MKKIKNASEYFLFSKILNWSPKRRYYSKKRMVEVRRTEKDNIVIRISKIVNPFKICKFTAKDFVLKEKIIISSGDNDQEEPDEESKKILKKAKEIIKKSTWDECLP